jgi:hypothetical protein
LVALAPSIVNADVVPAEALFQEGRHLLGEGRTDEACQRFADSYALEALSGTLINLALCHEKQGKTATAWAEYRATVPLAREQHREERAVAAEAKAALLEARLPRLTSKPVAWVPGLRMTTEDGTARDVGLLVTLPLDPGVHRLTVSAPGYLPWATTLELADWARPTLEIPRLEPLPPAPGPVPPPAAAAIAATRLVGPAYTPVDTSARRFYKRWWFWAGVGLSVAAGVTLYMLLPGRNSRFCSAEFDAGCTIVN